MDVPRLGGLGLVIGAVIFMIAVIPMSGIYGIQGDEARLARIRADQGAFLLSQALFGIGALVVAVGFLIVGVWAAARTSPLLSGAGVVGVVVGALLWAYFMYDRAANPEIYFGNYGVAPAYVWVSVIATSVGLGAFGLIALGLEGWHRVGYLTIASAALMLVGAVVAPEIVPPQLLYLSPLVIGVLVLRSGWPARAAVSSTNAV